MAVRKIVKIDEEKCNGCGLCVPSCAEGALRIVNGKARLVSEVYCDGLGACLGRCPQDAITIEERDAAEFDEAQVGAHLARETQAKTAPAACPSHVHHREPAHAAHGHHHAHAGGCPGAMARELKPATSAHAPAGAAAPSQLANWPVQLTLVPPSAPYFRNANLLLVADCVPFALADFHTRLLRGNPVAIACPKLDDTGEYVEKLAHIIRGSNLQSLTVVRMEVPCCGGLVRIAEAALEHAGLPVPFKEITIGIGGDVLAEVTHTKARA